jgi:hypothetical protein
MSNTYQIPAHIETQLEDLRGTIRGCNEAINSGNLEKWEMREFMEARDSTIARLAEWEVGIASLSAA